MFDDNPHEFDNYHSLIPVKKERTRQYLIAQLKAITQDALVDDSTDIKRVQVFEEKWEVEERYLNQLPYHLLIKLIEEKRYDLKEVEQYGVKSFNTGYQSIIPTKENYDKDVLITGLKFLTRKISWQFFLLTDPTKTDKLEEDKRFNQKWQIEKEYLETLSLKELTELINSKGYSTGEILAIYESVEG